MHKLIDKRWSPKESADREIERAKLQPLIASGFFPDDCRNSGSSKDNNHRLNEDVLAF